LRRAIAAPLLPEKQDAGSGVRERRPDRRFDLQVHAGGEVPVALRDQRTDVRAAATQDVRTLLNRTFRGEQQRG
jgi:hypothetical protein